MIVFLGVVIIGLGILVRLMDFVFVYWVVFMDWVGWGLYVVVCMGFGIYIRLV